MINLVTIELDRTRTIRLSVKAYKYIEKKLGKPVSKLGSDLSIDQMATILAAGLRHEDPEITEAKVIDLLEDHDVDLETLGETIGQAMLKKKVETDEEGNVDRATGN